MSQARQTPADTNQELPPQQTTETPAAASSQPDAAAQPIEEAAAPTVQAPASNGVPAPTAPEAEAESSPAAASTAQLETADLEDTKATDYRNTIPLVDSGAPPVPPLAEKDVLDERYRITSVLGSSRGTNLYTVQDLQGFRRCWACGSTASVEGETYCVDCGAQLTGRYYRLQEFNMPAGMENAELGDIAVALAPLPILENSVPGVAHAYDFLADVPRGRAYIVWEEIYGRPLSAWLPDAETSATLISLTPPGSSGQLPSMEEPDAGQAIFWMAQVAGILAALHSQGITGCNIGLDNLVVQAGDRIALVDPSGCAALPEPEQPPAWKADVQSLATALESWYVAVREEDLTPTGGQATNRGSSVMVSGVDEVTGPLNSSLNPR